MHEVVLMKQATHVNLFGTLYTVRRTDSGWKLSQPEYPDRLLRTEQDATGGRGRLTFAVERRPPTCICDVLTQLRRLTE